MNDSSPDCAKPTLGDPIDFVVKNYHLSLRKAEAGEILVQPEQA